MGSVNRTPIDPRTNHGMEHVLGIKGEQSMPDYADMSAVIPTIDMSMGGYARVPDAANHRFGTRAIALGGIAGIIASWISYGSRRNPADLLFDFDHNLALFGMSWHLNFDAAGIAAFATANIWVHTRLYDPAANWVHVHWQELNTSTDQLIYAAGAASNGFSATRIHLPVVPAGYYCDVAINSQAGGNFPANTELTIRAMGLQVPKGSPMPRIDCY